MKVKRIVKYLIPILCALIPIQSIAEGIAYVDARRLIDEAPHGRDEVKLLEEVFGERSSELKSRIEDFKLREAEFQKNAVLMSADELKLKTDELRELQRNLQRDQQIYTEDYTRSRNRGLAKLEKLISEVIIEMAIQRELDLVVQQVVYASKKIDMTDDVLDELKKRYEQ